MRRLILCLVTALAGVFASFAQTPEEILARMEEEMAKHDDSEGVVFTLDMKIIILGTMSSRSYVLGDKVYLETNAYGESLRVWSDQETTWTYNSSDNEVVIERKEKKDKEDGDMEMFSGIAEGYDLSMNKETKDAWYITCKKSKDNKEKDDPKRMDLVVSKADYMPVSLSAKVSGVNVTLRDISYGVSEEIVTFNPDKFPGVKIVDKRN